MEAARYSYRVEWSEEDHAHIGLCVEFPSLSFVSASVVDARKGIERLVSETLVEMLASQEIPPRPQEPKRSRSQGVFSRFFDWLLNFV